MSDPRTCPKPAHVSNGRALATALLCALATWGCAQPTAGAGEIEPSELLERIEAGRAPLLLDVRSAGEYASGHVPGAVNIPHDQLEGRIGEIEEQRNDEVVLYCESGRRAGWAAETLENHGFRRLRHLTGDMSAWRKAGLPTE